MTETVQQIDEWDPNDMEEMMHGDRQIWYAMVLCSPTRVKIRRRGGTERSLVV